MDFIREFLDTQFNALHVVWFVLWVYTMYQNIMSACLIHAVRSQGVRGEKGIHWTPGERSLFKGSVIKITYWTDNKTIQMKRRSRAGTIVIREDTPLWLEIFVLVLYNISISAAALILAPDSRNILLLTAGGIIVTGAMFLGLLGGKPNHENVEERS